MGIAAGYEDCNDHDTLKADPMLKLASGRAPISGDDLASQPTTFSIRELDLLY